MTFNFACVSRVSQRLRAFGTSYTQPVIPDSVVPLLETDVYGRTTPRLRESVRKGLEVHSTYVNIQGMRVPANVQTLALDSEWNARVLRILAKPVFVAIAIAALWSNADYVRSLAGGPAYNASILATNIGYAAVIAAGALLVLSAHRFERMFVGALQQLASEPGALQTLPTGGPHA